MSIQFGDLKKDAAVAGFRAEAVYKNGTEQAMGGRFVHNKSGFTLDLIEIQSVPQSFVCVHTFPTSNMGEPHTQEHLLLGKGNVGRAVAARETMSMVESTAFTQQLKTCYPFAANAGLAAYFEHFERSMYALLNPDYTDEEIRREVRNFGVKTGADGRLELEEKGTIYAEMVSATSQPGYRVYRAMGRLQLGPEHPMSFDSGGDPAYIRQMQPEAIRRFHAANYHLANIEMVASLPKGLTLEETLGRFDRILSKLQGDQPVRQGAQVSDLPAPAPAPAGTIQVVSFPSRNAQQPGPAQLAWPVMPRLNQRDESLAGLFAQAIGGDPATNFYKLFIDSKTRKMDIGARSVGMGFDNEAYAEFTIYIPDLAASQVQTKRLEEIRHAVQAELKRVASWPDNSPELLEFHERMQASLLRIRRSADKLTSSPPGFGARMGQSSWPSLLRELAEEPGFEKSLVQPELFGYLESVVHSGKNIWRDKIREWKLVELVPYVVASKPEAELIEAEEAALKQRLAAEVERLQAKYQVSDEQEAIRRYQKEYQEASAELERVQSLDAPAKFIDNPPMTLDEQLDYTVTQVNGIPLVTGRFAGMSSATVGLALNAKEWKGRQLLYASILPQLLSGAGATKDGKTLSFEDAMQQMRREILGVGASHVTNATTGRIEVVLSGAGNTLEESQTAIDWMQALLYAPNWGIANIARLKDVVDQTINTLRTSMQRSEENWVNGPADAWTYQDDPLLLSLSSFHTRLHHLHRLRWLLTEAPTEADRDAVAAFLLEIESQSPDRVASFLEKLPASAQALAQEAVKDLVFIAADFPANSAEADWKYLVRITRQDLLAPASQALEELEGVRKTLLKKSNARLFLTASPENALALQPKLAELVKGLSDAPRGASTPLAPRQVAQRVMAREKLETEPRFVGLVAPGMQGGVHLHSAPFVGIRDLDEESALRFLAVKLYGGGGPHGVFMKTWGAGLAYSNGLRSSASDGRINYYAERTPELPQTLEFVIQTLKKAPRDKPLADYALAQVFAGTRAGGSFESRTSAMAGDLADGFTPEVVKAFRQNILNLRKKKDLDAALYARMDAAVARVLPGYDPKQKGVAGATYYVIGPEKQLNAWEKYLGTKLYRLYGRDYWVIVD